jgi:hypothetical protein
VPPAAAGVLVAGFCFDTGAIGTRRSRFDTSLLNALAREKVNQIVQIAAIQTPNAGVGRLMGLWIGLGRAA